MYIFLVRPVLNIKPFQIQGFYLLSENILMPDISHIVQQKNSYFKSKVFFSEKNQIALLPLSSDWQRDAKNSSKIKNIS